MNTNKMTISTEKRDGIPTMVVEGNVRLEDSSKFIARVRKFTKGKHAKLLLDLTKIVFLDSAAIGVVCAAHMELKDANRSLAIAIADEPNSFVSKLFADVGLDKLLDIELL